MAPTAEIDGPAAVVAYLQAAPEPQRSTLLAVRATLRRELPTATEGLSYGMPGFYVDGRCVAAYAHAARHCSYHPMSGDVVAAAGAVLDGYECSKGTVRFPVDRPLPADVVRALVQLRLAELARSASRSSGRGA